MVVWVWPVELLTSVTFTPGTAALAGSATVPLNAPVADDWDQEREGYPIRIVISNAGNTDDAKRFKFIAAFLGLVGGLPTALAHVSSGQNFSHTHFEF